MLAQIGAGGFGQAVLVELVCHLRHFSGAGNTCQCFRPVLWTLGFGFWGFGAQDERHDGTDNLCLRDGAGARRTRRRPRERARLSGGTGGVRGDVSAATFGRPAAACPSA